MTPQERDQIADYLATQFRRGPVNLTAKFLRWVCETRLERVVTDAELRGFITWTNGHLKTPDERPMLRARLRPRRRTATG